MTPPPTRSSDCLAWIVAFALLASVGTGTLVSVHRAGWALPQTDTGDPCFLGWFAPAQILASEEILLEHAHRLAGMLAAGLVLLMAAVAAIRRRGWPGLRLPIALAALVGLSISAAVLLVATDASSWGAVHAGAGFLAAGIAWALANAPREESLPASASPPPAARPSRWAFFTAEGLALLVTSTLAAGVLMRHIAPEAGVWWYWAALWFHVVLATAAGAMAGLVRVAVGRVLPRPARAVRRANGLLGLVVAADLAGLVRWIAEFGWPCWLTDRWRGVDFVPVAGGPLQAVTSVILALLGTIALGLSLSMVAQIHHLVATRKG